MSASGLPEVPPSSSAGHAWWSLGAIRAATARAAHTDWAQIAGTSAARFYVVAVTMVITALTARFLGPEGRGVLVAAQGWVAAFAMLAYLSMAQPLFRRVSGRAPEEWLPEALGTLLAIVAAVTLLCWGIVAGAYAVTDGAAFKRLGPGVLATAFAALPFMLWTENGTSILLAMGRLRSLNLLQIAAGTASLAAVAVAVGAFDADVRSVLLASMVSPLLLAAGGIGVMLRHVRRLAPRWPVARQLLSEGARLHLNAVGSMLSNHAVILILNHYRSPAETAYLHLAAQMIVGLGIIPGAVGSVTYTWISRDGADGAWPAQKRLVLQALGLMLAVCTVAYLLAPAIIHVVGGPEFRPSIRLFRMLLPTLVLSTIAVGFGSQLVARAMFSWLAAYGLGVGFVTVVGMYLFIPRYGMDGAVWVSLGTALLGLILTLIVLVRIERGWRVRHAGAGVDA